MKAPNLLSVYKTLRPLRQEYCLRIFHKSRHPDTRIINLDENWHDRPLLGMLAYRPGEETFEVFSTLLMLRSFCQRESLRKGSDSISHFLYITIPANHLAILPISQAGNVSINFSRFSFLTPLCNFMSFWSFPYFMFVVIESLQFFLNPYSEQQLNECVGPKSISVLGLPLYQTCTVLPNQQDKCNWMLLHLKSKCFKHLLWGHGVGFLFITFTFSHLFLCLYNCWLNVNYLYSIFTLLS